MTAQTIATVTTMPGVRLVAVQRLSYEDRIGHLRELARSREWLDPAWVTILRDAFAHDSLTPQQRDDAWTAVLERLAIAAAVEAGIVDWDWKCAGPGGCGHAFAAGCECGCCPSAIDHARAVSGEALAWLAGGVR